jgi:hypothetical protein
MHLNFSGCQQSFCCSFVEKTCLAPTQCQLILGSSININLVIPIIDFVSFFITGGLTNARKRLFDLHLMNTEDHLFLHNGLSANIFSTLDANPLIESDCCDKEQPRGFLGQ